ncbi:MAG: hypothetical protein B7Y02_17410 [Rhodobacterales bacterium 17-64-5]|nr:MAG: hypothetical protein B7Y02_17410 [Rhodobacterales bacterium 17-64-5]
MRFVPVAALCLILAACVPNGSADLPMTMPPPDGRGQTVKVSSRSFVVNRRVSQGQPAMLRVTRLNGRDLDYSDGLMAKKAAEAYCASYNRPLDPSAMGRFSAPNSWLFSGDCK